MMKTLLHGAGTEGQAAATYFREIRAELYLHDDAGGSIEGVRSVDRKEAERLIDNAFYLRSPGVPPTHPLVQYANRKALLATTPTGFWLKSHAPKGTVTITGTKGKSTTTTLTTLLLQKAELSAAAYGNIGQPPLSSNLPREEHPVLELSSYMMHDLPQAEHIHLVTSLYRDHLDWHGGESAYREAKLRPFRQPRPVNGFAPREVILAEGLGSSVRAIEDATADDGERLKVGGVSIDVGDELQGFRAGPLRAALKAACAVATSFLPAEKVADAASHAASAWTGLPSRQAIIPSADGRIWVDDALATIPEATIAALQRFRSKPVALLLGGGDRGQDFTALERYLAEADHVTAIGFGPTSVRIRNLDLRADSFEDAIELAENHCPGDGVILFSPSAPSSAPYKDYKDRSAVFGKWAKVAR